VEGEANLLFFPLVWLCVGAILRLPLNLLSWGIHSKVIVFSETKKEMKYLHTFMKKIKYY